MKYDQSSTKQLTHVRLLPQLQPEFTEIITIGKKLTNKHLQIALKNGPKALVNIAT